MKQNDNLQTFGHAMISISIEAFYMMLHMVINLINTNKKMMPNVPI